AEKPSPERGLAASGLADESEGLPRANVEADAVDRLRCTELGAIPDAEVAYGQDGVTRDVSRRRLGPCGRLAAHCAVSFAVMGVSLRFGSVGLIVSLSPSPTRVSPTINSTIARPG